jgi:hypothetical protein
LIGYLLMDVERDAGPAIVRGIAKLETTVRADLLY